MNGVTTAPLSQLFTLWNWISCEDATCYNQTERPYAFLLYTFNVSVWTLSSNVGDLINHGKLLSNRAETKYYKLKLKYSIKCLVV